MSELNDCPHCGEPVLRHERRDHYANDHRWYHLECFARPVIGSVAHIEGRCGCYVPDSKEGDDPHLSKREAAKAAWRAYRGW